MMLWIEAAFGKQGLREVMDAATGPSAPEYLYALKLVLGKRAAEGAFSINAGSLDIDQSSLTQMPTQGPTAWEDISLQSDDTAVFAAFIPRGNWKLSTTPPAEGLSLTFDGKVPLPIDSETGVSLGELPEGWHSIELLNTGDATPLRTLELSIVPEA